MKSLGAETLLPFVLIFGALLRVLGKADTDIAPPSNIIELTDASADQLKSNESSEWLILFFADWCGACQVYKPNFYHFARWAGGNRKELKVATVDQSKGPLLLTRFFVTHLPTLYHVKNGEYRQLPFQGINLTKTIIDGSWEKLPPTRSWLTPFSFLCSSIAAVGYIGFHLADAMAKFQSYTGLNMTFTMALVAIVIISLFVGLTLLENFLIQRSTTPKSHSKKD